MRRVLQHQHERIGSGITKQTKRNLGDNHEAKHPLQLGYGWRIVGNDRC
jgi:hypothetical protein